MIKLKAESTRKHDDPADGFGDLSESVGPTTDHLHGNLNAGYSQAIGNSYLRSISLVGDLVARSEQRLTILGRYVYGDNAGSLITRHARGTI